MTKIGDEILDVVLDALPDRPPGLKPSTVWIRVGRWSDGTIRLALAEVATRGRAECFGGKGFFRYWRGMGGSPPVQVRFEVVGVRPPCEGESEGRRLSIAGFVDRDEAIAFALGLDMFGWEDIFVRPFERPESAMVAALRGAAE